MNTNTSPAPPEYHRQAGEEMKQALVNTIKSAIERFRRRQTEEKLILLLIPAVLLPDRAVAAVVLAAAAGILCFGRQRSLLLGSPAAGMLLPLLLVLTVPSLISHFASGLLTGFIVWVILLLALVIAENMTAEIMSDVLDGLLLLSAAAAVYGVYCQFAGILEKNRVGSIFENPNHYAYAIEMFVITALCQYSIKKKPVYLIAAAVNALMNILCGCRTAWLCIMAGIIIFVMLSVRRRWLLPVTVSACAAFAGVITLIPDSGGRLSQNGISSSLGNRMRYWDNALRWFRERPVTGWGVLSYSFLSEMDGEKILSHAHNMILNILLDTGIIGFVVIAAFSAMWLWSVFCAVPAARVRPYRNLALSVIAATLIHGITDFTLLGVSPSLIFVLIVSVSGCIRREK